MGLHDALKDQDRQRSRRRGEVGRDKQAASPGISHLQHFYSTIAPESPIAILVSILVELLMALLGGRRWGPAGLLKSDRQGNIQGYRQKLRVPGINTTRKS